MCIYNAGAQSFSAPVGIAQVVSPGVYNLTPTTTCGYPYHNGAIWCTTTIDFTNSFVLTYQASFDHAVGIGADGICVAFGQNITATSINGTNAFFGYYNTEYAAANPDFNQSFGIEFDIFDNSSNPYMDDIPGTDHIAVCPNAVPTVPCPGGGPIAISPSTTNIKDGVFHNYRIEWCPAITTLKVYYNDTLRVNSIYDYTTLFTTPAAIHWGFSGGTGAYCSNQRIQDVVLTTGIGPSITSSRDTTACIAGMVTLYADTGGTHLWSTGDTTDSVSVSPVGTYWVTTTSSCTYKADTVHFINSASVNLGNDTSFCSGNSLVLSPTVAPGTTLSWSTGTTGPSITVSTTGTYWVTVNTGSCTASDTINITLNPIPAVSLGPDTTVCSGSPPLLQSTGAFAGASYLWSTGSTTGSIYPAISGTYWETITQAGCSGSDSIIVTFDAPPAIEINDTFICMGSTITLSPAVTPASALAWSTGVVAPTITVNTAGAYWVTANDGICTTTDTIHVAVIPLPVVSLGLDQSVCVGTPVVLQSSETYTAPSYLWSTGSTATNIMPVTTDIYWLNVTVAGCTGSDTLQVTFIPLPVVSLGNDTTICPETEITLSDPQPAGAQYTWSIGSNTTSIAVTEPGTYWLTILSGGCSAADTIMVSLSVIPIIALGSDTTLCTGETLLLNLGGESAMWSNSTDGTGITVIGAGSYWASIDGPCGIVSDTIQVSYINCDIWIPSAFTPNNDGLNDQIRVGGSLAAFTDFSFSVYNRFGQRVFYTEDIYAGWNGVFNDTKQDVGTFFYMVFYTLQGTKHMMKGDFQLIR